MQAVFFRPVYVKRTLVFPSIALAAEFLPDPLNYPMTIFKPEILSRALVLLFETLAAVFTFAFLAVQV